MQSAFLSACRGFITLFSGVVAVWVCIAPRANAQELLLPADREEIADQERLSSWTLDKFPAQPFMKEIYWDRRSQEMPAFFRDSLVQYVARTYYMNRDNFDGTKSQAWAAGGWLAFRSGLIGDLFGVHAAFYHTPVGYELAIVRNEKPRSSAQQFTRRIENA